jgi:hypothetical protein
LERLQQAVGRDRLLILAFHDIYSFFGTAAGQQRYYNYYGYRGRPMVVFDGVDIRTAGNTNPNTPQIDAQYRDAYLRRAAMASPVKITASGTLDLQRTPRRASLSAMIEALSQLSGPLKVRFVLYEDNLNYRAPNGETHFDWVVRAILEDGSLTISQPGQTMMFNRAVDLNPQWTAPNLGLAVFVQRDTDKVVLGAADVGFPSPQ